VHEDATNRQDPNVLLAVFRGPRTNCANDAGKRTFLLYSEHRLLTTLKCYNSLLQLMAS